MVKKRGLDRVIARHYSSPSHKKTHNQPLPIGIKVLISYAVIVAFFYLLYLIFDITKPTSVFFGSFIYGTAANVIEFTGLIVLVAIIYGLIKRHYWAFLLSLFWFSFGTVNAVVSFIRFRNEFDVLKGILLLSSFVVVILNGIIAWYVYSEKGYFRTKHLNKETKAKDRFFVHIITTFIIVSLLALLTFGVIFYKDTIQTANRLVPELKNAQLPQLVCAQKEAGEKDLCYLIISIMDDNKDGSVCDNIGSDFYKMTCYRAIQ